MANEYIRLLDGSRWYFDGRAPLAVSTNMLLQALYNLNRFTGHTHDPYSVLQHSLNVAEYVKESGGAPEVIRAALVHDLHEVLVGDVATPLKRHLRWLAGHENSAPSYYDIVEHRAKREIAARFDVPVEDHDLVLRADAYCLRVEALQFQAIPTAEDLQDGWPFSHEEATYWERERGLRSELGWFDPLSRRAACHLFEKLLKATYE